MEQSGLEPQGGESRPTRQASSEPDHEQFTRSVASLADMLRAYRTGQFSISRKEVVLLIVAAVYILSPVDIVPEAVVGPLGLLDDLGALLGAVGVIGAALKRFRKQ